MMRDPFPIPHSVLLDPEKCVGCEACVKNCPTGAIRVLDGRASVRSELCIDCGECIRACPHGAKRAGSDPLAKIASYRLRVAIPAPALYGQYGEGSSVDRLLSGLLELGFDEVFDVAEAAAIVDKATAELLSRADTASMPMRPLISSACPAVVRLIQLRFPGLIPHLIPLIPPMEAAARIVKERLHPGEDGVGVFFITPCAGKVTVTLAPLGYAKSAIDGVIGLSDIHLSLLSAIASAPARHLARAGREGLEPARLDGAREAVGERGSISVDGIGNVIAVLEALENGEIPDLPYIEALACPAGCIGGPLTVEKPSIAKTRLLDREERIRAGAPDRRFRENPIDLRWTEALKPRTVPERLITAETRPRGSDRKAECRGPDRYRRCVRRPSRLPPS